MVSNDSAPGSYVKQLDTKPFNNKAELAKWRNTLLQNNNQLDNADQETVGYIGTTLLEGMERDRSF